MIYLLINQGDKLFKNNSGSHVNQNNIEGWMEYKKKLKAVKDKEMVNTYKKFDKEK